MPRVISGQSAIQHVPSFSISRDDASTVGHTGVIDFNTVGHNVGGPYDTSNDRFVVPVAGLYSFSLSALGAGNSGGGQLASTVPLAALIQFSTDSGSSYTAFAQAYAYVNGASIYPNVSISAERHFNPGDFVRLNVTNGYLYGDASGNYDPLFSGFLVTRGAA